MKVLDLRCANGHGFEGWFASEDDFLSQNGRGLIECPMCSDRVVTRMPSAPRLNLSGAREPLRPSADTAGSSAAEPPATPMPNMPQPSPSQPTARVEPVLADLHAQWLRVVRHAMENTTDVGERFPEEARRIHYGEAPERGIRGQATPEEREALREEGIEVVALPVPAALKRPLQ